MNKRTSAAPIQFFEELKQRRRDLVKSFGPAVLVTLIGFLIALYFVEPPPSSQLVVAAGPRNGNYYATTREYAEIFEQNGVELVSLETVGSIENYKLLLNDPQVNLAIVQAGTVPDLPGVEKLESLASLYREPLWVIHHSDVEIRDLSDLQGKRIAIGEMDSGTHVLSEMLLNENGVVNGEAETQFLFQGRGQLQQMILDREIDAGFLVMSAESQLVREILLEPKIEVMDFQRGQAYSRRFPFLKAVTLEQGVVDLQLNLPNERINLIAPVANLVATPELHDAYIPLLIESAIQIHDGGNLVSAPSEMPALDGVEFDVNPIARHYFQHGPSFLQKFFGLWIASIIDRAKIMFVPLIVLLIPLVKLAPPVYRWQIRSRIYRWYALLRGIDQSVRGTESTERAQLLQNLLDIEKELGDINVPLSYMEEFYNLRLHIDLLKRRLSESETGDESTSMSED